MKNPNLAHVRHDIETLRNQSSEESSFPTFFQLQVRKERSSDELRLLPMF
jgi:hypothetical protein